MWIWIWMLFMLFAFVLPLVYGWAFRGWGPPIPRGSGSPRPHGDPVGASGWGWIASAIWAALMLGLVALAVGLVLGL